MPNGIGILDEQSEAITQIQTKIIQKLSIVIFDSEYHSELIEHTWRVAKNESINSEDMKLLFVTNSNEELAKHIKVQPLKIWLGKRGESTKTVLWISLKNILNIGYEKE